MRSYEKILAFEHKSFECAECPGGKNCFQRIPCAENDERNGNPAGAGGDVFLPARNEYKRKIRAAKSADKAAAKDVNVFIQRYVYS